MRIFNRTNPGKCQNIIMIVLALMMVLLPGASMARDDASYHSIADAMNTATAKSFSGVSFYFGEQAHSEPKSYIGTYTSKKTTNAFNKSDSEACQWVFLSAIKSFYERAIRSGANAVVNIQSVTTGQPVSSSEEFVCRVGNVVAKVYVTADVVIL